LLKVSEFVHLHVHTEYSLLDGMIRIKDLVDRTEKFQMPAVAMTDHGNMFGAVQFYTEARKKGIKPIIGCEVYVAPNGRKDRDAVGNHLVLLCKNMKGYKNLCQLVSAGFIEGFYYKPRVDMQLISEHHEGLIAMSACLKGKVASALLEDNLDEATAAAGRFKEIFDNNRFFLELQENGIEDQRRVNRAMIKLGKKLGIGLVASNDCHYLNHEDAHAHEVLLCIQTGKTMSDEKRMRFSTDQVYFAAPGEMKEKFAEVPDAITNTLEIANRCNFEWDLKAKHFPVFPTEDDMTLEEMLWRQAREGFQRRLSDIRLSDPRFESRRAEYDKRLEYELNVIRDMEFAGYFLIVADFVNHARSQGIAVGPGRGSAAGSLVSYCLGITDINPLAYGLIFERFLNPERRGLPDIDMDFCQERREEVLKYVTQRYGGSEFVAQIITFGTMKARAVVRDVGRAMDVPLSEVDRLAKLIPATAKNLDQALKEEPRLREMRDRDPKIADLLANAEPLEGIARHASVHAAGVVISDLPLTEYLPLYKDQKEDKVVSQFEKDSVEKVGLIKFDLLGLKTLTQIRNCVELIKQNRGVELAVNKLQPDDKDTFALLAAGDAGGVFQLESSGMKDLLIRLAPERFEEIIAVNALYRPGPLGSGFHDRFVERKHGREPVTYLLPQMEEALKETYGVLVYQEQVMELAVRIAGFTMGEADTLRKAMGKKKTDLMKEQEDKFVEGAKKKKISPEKAREVWDYMAPFAEYGFNKSHAAAYAYVSYQTAYLKTHFRSEFMASLMTMDMADSDKLVRYLKECEDNQMTVDPPHVNQSGWAFSVAGDKVIFGLGAIKGVGKAAVEAIVEAREQTGSFKTLYDFCERVDLKRVNRRTLESLIKAGAFDNLGAHRAQSLAALERALEFGHKTGKERDSGQTSFFDLLGESSAADFISDSYPDVKPWSSREMLSFEKEALGYYLTGHPLARFERMMQMYGLTETTQVPFLSSGQETIIGGLVTAKKEIISKKKERMAFITITDLKGSLEVVVFASVYKEARAHLETDDVPVIVRGRVEVSEDKAKILAGEILPLEQAAEKIPLTLHLTIHRPLAGESQINLIAGILKSHRGRARVLIHVIIPDRSETLISLPAEFRVSPDDKLLSALRELPGVEEVKLEAA
jgi:DNA polymerase III subunit alpha